MTKELVDIEMAAHGGTVFEIVKGADGKWSVVRDSPATTAASPPIRDDLRRARRRQRPPEDLRRPDGHPVTRHHQQLRRRHDALGHLPDGRGKLPRLFLDRCGRCRWPPDISARPKPQHGTLRRARALVCLGQYHDRFNIDKEPNEPNRFGYIVEVDPLNPDATPIKHTALGSLPARRRRDDHRVGRQAGDLFGRRQPLRLSVQVGVSRAGDAGKQPSSARRCCRKARSMWRASTTTAP
jgi:hypothetical protein